MLSQLKHFMNTPKRKPFNDAHISPHLTYASTVWGGCSGVLLNLTNLALFLEQLKQSYGI